MSPSGMVETPRLQASQVSRSVCAGIHERSLCLRCSGEASNHDRVDFKSTEVKPSTYRRGSFSSGQRLQTAVVPLGALHDRSNHSTHNPETNTTSASKSCLEYCSPRTRMGCFRDPVGLSLVMSCVRVQRLPIPPSCRMKG